PSKYFRSRPSNLCNPFFRFPESVDKRCKPVGLWQFHLLQNGTRSNGFCRSGARFLWVFVRPAIHRSPKYPNRRKPTWLKFVEWGWRSSPKYEVGYGEQKPLQPP